MAINTQAYELAFAKWWFRHMDTGGRKRLWRKLGKMIKENVPIIQALESLANRRRVSKGKGDPQVIAIECWLKGMKNGRQLGHMLDGWVGDVERMLISTGEQTGTIDQALLSANRVMTASSDITSAVLKGLAYPALLFVLAFGVMYLFGFKVVPEFTKIIPAERFTGMAKVLILLSSFAKNWLFVTAGALIAVIVTFFVSLNRWDGPLRTRLDRYPPFSIYRIVVGSTWLIGLAAMLEAGMRLDLAMEQLSGMSGKWLKTRIVSTMRGMRAGLGMGDALHRGGYEFPDREIIDDIAVYSSLSGFESSISIIGEEWLTESVAQIQSRMAVLRGVALICVAILISSMVSGMMNMQIQMSQFISQKSR